MNTKPKPEGQSVLDFLSEKILENQSQLNPANRKLSQQMIAVLLIFSADPFLMEAVRPHINLETESIDSNRKASQRTP